MHTDIQINPTRLQKLIDDFAAIGKTPKGGVTRLTLTDLDKQARDLFIDLAKAANCNVKIDAIGNIFARRSGKNNQLAPVLTGSHGDTQPQGGRFDGIYGVLAGLEALYSLNDHNIETERPIDLVMWTNEEGARFAPALTGSAVFAGQMPLAQALVCEDAEGKTIGQELERIGYNGTDDFSDYQAHAALEIHIEQGPLLENNHNTIGVVTGALGQKWFEVNITGLASHAGTTPMNLRQDALLGLALSVAAVNDIGQAEMPDGRATVGMVQIQPNSRNVIAGEAWFSVEFRHPSEDALEQMEQKLRQAVEAIASRLNLSAQITPVLSFPPVYFDQMCIDTVRETAQALGYPCQDIVSGAGHDACSINHIAPISMIFIPCIGGLSHNEAEDITPEWANAGAHVLLHSLLTLAGRSEK